MPQAHHVTDNHGPRSGSGYRAGPPTSARLFPGLPGWVPAGVDAATKSAGINAFVARQMIVPQDVDASASENADVPAGYTYFQQLIDHDLTFDPSTPGMCARGEGQLRQPSLNLDSLYGGGPHQQPYLYYGNPERAAFVLGAGQNPRELDLPRNTLGRALIADARNDGNLLLSQLHLALMRLHNRVLQNLVASGEPLPGTNHFAQARRIVAWFYQYVVWNDFVARLVDPLVHADVLQQAPGVFELNNKFYNPVHQQQLPPEFTAAAFRLAPSMRRAGYQVNASHTHGVGIERPLHACHRQGLHSLDGRRQLPVNYSLQWDWFLPFPSSPGCGPQPSQSISPRIVQDTLATDGDLGSCGAKTIQTNWHWGLPSGSDVARCMGIEPIVTDSTTPGDCLWVYILREAAAREGGSGRRLGPVGSRIVAEVIAGRLYQDEEAYIRCDPTWTPGRESALPYDKPINGGDWQLADLIYASGACTRAEDIAVVA